MRKETKALFCPLQGVIDVISKKWSLLVINEIGNHKIIRFTELRKELRDITPKSLTTTLNDLQSDSLVSKKVFNEIPPRVEYTLTSDGKGLYRIITPLIKWASSRDNAATLVTDKLSIIEVLGQQAADNFNNSPTAAIDTGEIIEVSIVPGAAALGDKAYSPNPINIKDGDTIVWTNDDTSETPFHTVTSGTGSDDKNKGQEFDSGLTGATALMTKGTTFTHTFDVAGEFPYFCQLHPTMKGKVITTL